jgi:hypothetical protein
MPCSSVPSTTSWIAPDDSPGGQARGSEVLGRKGATVEQVPAALPVRLGIGCDRLFGDEHDVLDQGAPDRLRHDDQQVDVIWADDHDRGGEDLVSVSDCPAQGGPVAKIDFGEVIGSADRGPLVATDGVGDGDSVGEEASDGRRWRRWT